MKITNFKFRKGQTGGLFTIKLNGKEAAVGFDGDPEKYVFSDSLNVAIELGLDFSENLAILQKEYASKLKNREAILEAERIENWTSEYNRQVAKWDEWLKEVNDTDVKISYISLEKYLAASYQNFAVFMEYKDTFRQLDRDRFNYEQKFYWNDWTTYRSRTYKKINSAVAKFKEKVDQELEEQAQERKEKREREERHANDLAKYSALFGEVIHEKVWVNDKYNSNGGYTTDKYKIPTKAGQLPIHQKTYSGSNGLFVLAGIGNLTEDQVKAIIEIANQ